MQELMVEIKEDNKTEKNLWIQAVSKSLENMSVFRPHLLLRTYKTSFVSIYLLNSFMIISRGFLNASLKKRCC